MDLLALFLNLLNANIPSLTLFQNVQVTSVNVIYLILILINPLQNYDVNRCTVALLVIPAFFFICLNIISGPDCVYLSFVCGEMNK